MPIPTFLQKFARACRYRTDAADQPQRGKIGAAIDINPAFADFWLWRQTAGTVPGYVNHIPPEIVAVFERHRFIWGSRWAHFDTMHFEYPPELLGSDGMEERAR
jgi:D-alanyl-D-alanine carboxypeptidase